MLFRWLCVAVSDLEANCPHRLYFISFKTLQILKCTVFFGITKKKKTAKTLLMVKCSRFQSCSHVLLRLIRLGNRYSSVLASKEVLTFLRV